MWRETWLARNRDQIEQLQDDLSFWELHNFQSGIRGADGVLLDNTEECKALMQTAIAELQCVLQLVEAGDRDV